MKRFLFGLALLTLGVSTAQVNATTMSPLTQDQMTDASDLVVRGIVTETWTERDDIGRIWTRVQVEVNDTFKGDAVEGVLISQMGGVYANDYQPMHGAPVFDVGEEGYFFLEHLEGGYTGVVGWWQGKYTVRLDPDSGQEMLVRFVVSQDAWYDHRFIPHPDVADRIYVDDFEAGLKTRVATGWDGEPIPGTSLERLERVNTVTTGVNR